MIPVPISWKTAQYLNDTDTDTLKTKSWHILQSTQKLFHF